jgi:hypothetical protein
MPVTLSDYRRLVADHPVKFSEREVGYTPAASNKTDKHCDDCLHFYAGKAARRNVCEIMQRSSGGSVEPRANCRFWTVIGLHYPLLKEDSDGR